MSSISSVSSSILSSLFSSRNTRTSSSSSAVETLFSQLDTTGKGYLEKSDLSTAFSQISSSSTSSASVDDVFAKLDSDSDGKVTEDELSSGLDALASELDAQFNQMRMSGAMPPPPPPSDSDTGFTQDELESQLSEIDSNDSQRSDLLNKIVANFDTADTNSDGKVSFAEAQAYDQSTSSTASSASSTSTTASSSTDSGFTVDELTQQLSEIGSSDSKRSDLLNKIVANFEAADTDGDGKVSNSEAMAYDQSSASSTASATDSTTSSDLAIMKRIMELMDAYALTSGTDSSSVANTLSVSA